MRKNLCNAIVYENKTNPGLVIVECGFWRYIELRKAELGNQEDIRIMRTVRALPTPINLWLCLIRKSCTHDNRPKTPEGKYRIG
jgi:hypothetical protein